MLLLADLICASLRWRSRCHFYLSYRSHVRFRNHAAVLVLFTESLFLVVWVPQHVWRTALDRYRWVFQRSQRPPRRRVPFFEPTFAEISAPGATSTARSPRRLFLPASALLLSCSVTARWLSRCVPNCSNQAVIYFCILLSVFRHSFIVYTALLS